MGASGKMDARIPPDAGEQSLRLKLRPAVRVLACYLVVGVTSAANSSLKCTGARIGGPGRFKVMPETGTRVFAGKQKRPAQTPANHVICKMLVPAKLAFGSGSCSERFLL